MNPDQTAPLEAVQAGIYIVSNKAYNSSYADERADDNCSEWQGEGL